MTLPTTTLSATPPVATSSNISTAPSLSNGLTEFEMAQARGLADELALGNLQTIHSFGRELGTHTAAEVDVLLAQVKGKDLDVMGSKLGQIVSAAQTLNLHALSNTRSRIPLIGTYIDKLRLKKNDFVRQFQDVGTQVGTLVTEVEGMQKGLGDRVISLEAAFVSVKEEHGLLGIHVYAGEMALTGLKERIAQPRDDMPGQELQDLIASVAALDKRVADLRMLQHSALQQLPMIRMVQTNNRMLIEKFHTIKVLTVPAWKRQFMLAVALNEQRNAVQLANTIDDATNEFLRENARLLKDNTVSTAQANQRMVIDIETLQEVHDSLLSTVQEVIRINQEGAQQRVTASQQLETMRQSLAKQLESN